MSDPWYPPGTDNPAFQVQRQAYGLLTGGDYVRGSSVTTLQRTALRYPSTTPEFDAAENKAILHLRPIDYETAEIAWGWPVEITENWNEVALIRSGFGNPITVMDGQTVFRALKPDFTTARTPTRISPAISPATTPDVNDHITDDWELRAYASIEASSHEQFVASLYASPGGGHSWAVLVATDGRLRFRISTDGMNDVGYPLASAAEMAALPRGPEGLVLFGVRFNKDTGGGALQAITADTWDQAVWTTFGTPTTTGSSTDSYNTTTALYAVGSRSDGAASTRWEGHIAKVSTNDGGVVKTFDAETYFGGGLTWSGNGVMWTITDANTVLQAIPEEMAVPPPLVYDRPLQAGQWYYYSLFFRIGSLDWMLGMTGSVLIPRNYRHAEHLWNGLPPFYRYTDSNQREGDGPLRQFLSIFGFELDKTREYVEQWQEAYHIDKSPMTLLKQVGRNFDVPYKGAVGDIRYRAMLAALPELLRIRGTTPAVRHVIEAGSKCVADVTSGSNVLLLPDDSDFYTGIGSWGTLHPTVDTLDAGLSTVPALFRHGTQFTGPPTGNGRGTMRVVTTKANETANLTIAVGASVANHLDDQGAWVEQPAVIPLYTAVPVEEGFSYGFSIYVLQELSAVVTPYLLWFDKTGQPSGYLSKTAGNAFGPANTTWYQFVVQGTAPTNAVYMVPALQFTTRPASSYPTLSPYIELAGATAYVLSASGKSIAVVPPDNYITLGDPAELLGPPDPATGFPGYIIGAPPT